MITHIQKSIGPSWPALFTVLLLVMGPGSGVASTRQPCPPAGMAYLPIPIGGALTGLFIVERLLVQDIFPEPVTEPGRPLATE